MTYVFIGLIFNDGIYHVKAVVEAEPITQKERLPVCHLLHCLRFLKQGFGLALADPDVCCRFFGKRKCSLGEQILHLETEFSKKSPKLITQSK